MQRLGKPAIVHRLLASFVITLGIGGPAFGQTKLTFTVGGVAYSADHYPATAGTTPHPVVVMAHGVDGMGGESGKQIDEFAKQLAGEGYVVIVPHYFDTKDGGDSSNLKYVGIRMANRANYPPRIAAAVDLATVQPNIDKNRLGLVGFSLGGGLVLEHAESKPGTVKAVVDFFGYIKGTSITSEVAKLPPTLVLHNKMDGIVPVNESSKLLLEALGKTMPKVEHDHTYYDNGNPDTKYHTFIPGSTDEKDSRDRCITWLKKYVP